MRLGEDGIGKDDIGEERRILLEVGNVIGRGGRV